MPQHEDNLFGRFPRIELEGITLRNLRIADSRRYCAITSDPLVAQFIADEDIAESLDEAVRQIRYLDGLFARRESFFWGIADSETDSLLGTVGFSLWNRKHNYAEVAYELASTHWRQGIMSQALKSLLDFAFEKMSLDALWAKTMMHNVASYGLLEKFYFKYQGIIHNYRKIKGLDIDVRVYRILREDWLRNLK